MDLSCNNKNKAEINLKTDLDDAESSTEKPKARGRKRKRQSSSSSSDNESVLPENTLEIEKTLYNSAIKNNLDETSIKKILKKVVTNDHVLALVKIKEEEQNKEEASVIKKETELAPKLTRAKVKELMKVSPRSAPKTLVNIELTPIKHIPVKTRPEVKALIGQELHDDEEDEEYEPTQDDVPSDDDQTMESCSDLDSMPRTPATPQSYTASPKVVTDGPFKVPQDIQAPARRKLDLEEEATIALRTRSKLSLSATPIEHIESSFVPPDELPMPDVDGLWSDFLMECLNPASTSKNEEDDETDPEYNVAADPDAHEEDEETLENSILKISKKELNDLVTELFSVMPDSTVEKELSASFTDHSLDNTTLLLNQTHWEGKQEILSDEENQRPAVINSRTNSGGRISVGKTEPEDQPDEQGIVHTNEGSEKTGRINVVQHQNMENGRSEEPSQGVVKISVVESEWGEPHPPPALQRVRRSSRELAYSLTLDTDNTMLAQQRLILEQQLRQHVQLATSNFLQLYVHPVHWKLAPSYREYLESLYKMWQAKPKSIVNVCNMRPAWELVTAWEKTVSVNSPENIKMIEFIQGQVERNRRRAAQNSLYVGEFHENLLQVVANSSVFLYASLLPPLPYRTDLLRRYTYLLPEDELIALTLDQFWEYVEMNPGLFKRQRGQRRTRWGLVAAAQLVCRHVMPWVTVKALVGHINKVRRGDDKDNPIYKFLHYREIKPVEHKLLPYDPSHTPHDLPEQQMPRIWLRYLAKTNKKFRKYMHRRTPNMAPVNPLAKVVVNPLAKIVDLGESVVEPKKKPLPADFNGEIPCSRSNLLPKPDTKIANSDTLVKIATNVFNVVNTSTGSYLVPLVVQTKTVNTNTKPITTPIEASNQVESPKVTSHVLTSKNHCKCCKLLRKICKLRQSTIKEYFMKKTEVKCPCSEVTYSKISNKLKLLVDFHKSQTDTVLNELKNKLDKTKWEIYQRDIDDKTDKISCELEELAFVTNFQMRLSIRTGIARNNYIKQKIYTLLSKFNIEKHSPLRLLGDLYNAFKVELVDMYQEFIGFLTPDQADEIGRFKDYFLPNCLPDLVKRIEEQIQDKCDQRSILTQVHDSLNDKSLSSCDICTSVLTKAAEYPTLARYIFSLFPHKFKRAISNGESPKESSMVQEISIGGHCEESLVVMDYEADHSSSDEETTENIERHDKNNGIINRVIKQETYDTSDGMENGDYDIKNDDNSSDSMSMQIMSDDDTIKTEPIEWKREEDKLILEVLKESVTPADRQHKTFLEIVEEKNVLQELTQRLDDKSECDIMKRMAYLIEILGLNDT